MQFIIHKTLLIVKFYQFVQEDRWVWVCKDLIEEKDTNQNMKIMYQAERTQFHRFRKGNDTRMPYMLIRFQTQQLNKFKDCEKENRKYQD